MNESSSHTHPVKDDKDTARLEAFSDGVFSIAMTLLVLELAVPTLADKSPLTSSAALWSALGRQWPSYFAFLTSFGTVLIMWVNHHGIFRLIRRCDGALLFANGFLLLLVTVVPFPTALIAKYLRTPAASVACIVYGATFVLISISYGLVLVTARRGGHLTEGSKREADERIRSCYLLGTPLYLLATAAAIVSPAFSLLICTGLWIYWAVIGARRPRA